MKNKAIIGSLIEVEQEEYIKSIFITGISIITIIFLIFISMSNSSKRFNSFINKINAFFDLQNSTVVTGEFIEYLEDGFAVFNVDGKIVKVGDFYKTEINDNTPVNLRYGNGHYYYTPNSLENIDTVQPVKYTDYDNFSDFKMRMVISLILLSFSIFGPIIGIIFLSIIINKNNVKNIYILLDKLKTIYSFDVKKNTVFTFLKTKNGINYVFLTDVNLSINYSYNYKKLNKYIIFTGINIDSKKEETYTLEDFVGFDNSFKKEIEPKKIILKKKK